MLGAYQFQALHDAALLGDTQQIDALLEAGARIDARSPNLQQAIHVAARGGQLNTVAVLLDRLASVNAHDRKGDRPIHMAAERGHEALMGYLLNQRALINSPNDAGDQPLHVAARRGQHEMVFFLLNQGAGINARNIHGDHPIHAAAWGGHKNVLELLLDSGAHLVARNARNEQPILAALARGHRDVVVCMLDRGALSNERELVTEVTQGPISREMVLFVWQYREASRAMMDAELCFRTGNIQDALTQYHKAATMFREEKITWKAAIALTGAARCELRLRLFKACLTTTQDALELNPPRELAEELREALNHSRRELGGGAAALPAETEAWLHHIFVQIQDPVREQNKGQINKSDLAQSCRSNPIVATFFGVKASDCQGEQGRLLTDALFEELDRNGNGIISWNEFRAFYVEKAQDNGLHMDHLKISKVCHLCGSAVAGKNLHGQELTYWCQHCDLLMTTRGFTPQDLEPEPKKEVVIKWRRLYQIMSARAHVYGPDNYRHLPNAKTRMQKKEVAKPKLEVTIIRAADLNNLDQTGASDPYCICEIPGEDGGKPKYSFETKPIYDNVNPVWNHKHVFQDIAPADSLEFYVWDADEESPDLLGSLMLVPSDFFPNGFEGTKELEDELGDVTTSTLTVAIKVLQGEELEETLLPLPIPASPSLLTPPTPTPWSWSPGSLGAVRFELQEARDLRAQGRDAAWRTGLNTMWKPLAVTAADDMPPDVGLAHENEVLRLRVAELEWKMNSDTSNQVWQFSRFREFNQFQQFQRWQREGTARPVNPMLAKSPGFGPYDELISHDTSPRSTARSGGHLQAYDASRARSAPPKNNGIKKKLAWSQEKSHF